jgi:hypothetical protein
MADLVVHLELLHLQLGSIAVCGRDLYTECERYSTMIQNRQRRGLLLIAAIAIGIALLFMLVPHGHAGGSPDWLAILPILFLGVISPLSLLPPLACVYAGRTPDAPALPSRFQRPPPFPRA